MGHQATEATRTSISDAELARREAELARREAELARREAELNGWDVIEDDSARLEESDPAPPIDESRVHAMSADECAIAHGAGLAMSAEECAIEWVRISENIYDKTVIANTWILALIGLDGMEGLREAIVNWVTQATMWSTSLSTLQEEPEDTSEVLSLARTMRMQEEMRQYELLGLEFSRFRAAMSKVDVPID